MQKGEGAEGKEDGKGGGQKPEREKWDEEPDRGVDLEMEQFKKGETVRPRKDRAAAPAYQLFHKTSVLISMNSNDKCGPLWQRLINSQRGETHQSKI